MKKIILISLLLPFLHACFLQPKPSDLVFDDSEAQRNYRNLASDDYDVVPYVTTRAYVESTLNQIFGSTGDTTVESAVYQKKEFGGACDRYAPSDTGASAYEFPRSQCYTGITIVQPSNSNPMRYSYTAKICESLVNNATRFTYAMKQIIPAYVAGQKLADPSDASIIKAYQLFFQSESPSAEVVNALKGISSSSTMSDEAWKRILVTLCVSPEWQVF